MVISLGRETRIGAIVRYWFVDSNSSIAQDAFLIVSASVVGRGAVLRALTTSAVGMRWILTLQPTHLHVLHEILTGRGHICKLWINWIFEVPNFQPSSMGGEDLHESESFVL